MKMFCSQRQKRDSRSIKMQSVMLLSMNSSLYYQVLHTIDDFFENRDEAKRGEREKWLTELLTDVHKGLDAKRCE